MCIENTGFQMKKTSSHRPKCNSTPIKYVKNYPLAKIIIKITKIHQGEQNVDKHVNPMQLCNVCNIVRICYKIVT